MLFRRVLCGLLVLFFLATSIAAAGQIRVVKNAEIILGDRDNYFRVYDDRNIRDQTLRFDEVKNFSRDYEGYDEIVACDVDGNGVDEIVMGDVSDNKIHIYNATGRSLVELASRDVGFEREDHLACGDVDGDGKDEIVVADNDRDKFVVIYVEGRSTSTVESDRISYGIWGGDGFAVGDVWDDNTRAPGRDGKAEILHADTDRDRIYVFTYTQNTIREVKSFPVKFKEYGMEYNQYDREDEIAVCDVDGDGFNEIVFGNGEDTHSVHVFEAESSDDNVIISFSFKPTTRGFTHGDRLVCGDVNMDGVDEIVIGDDDSGKIYVFTADGRELASMDVDFSSFCEGSESLCYSDGIAIGDIDGDSIVVEEMGCTDGSINNQVIAVINAPPKHAGINFNPNDPFYAQDFSIKYEKRDRSLSSYSTTLVQDVAVSAKLSAEWGTPFVKKTFKLGFSRSFKWKEYEATEYRLTVAEGLTVENYDVAITLTAPVQFCEFKIVKPESMAVINGEQQYIMVTKPKGSPTVYKQDLMNPQHYTNLGIPQLHNVGNILTYPSNKNGLYHYSVGSENLSRQFDVSSTAVHYYYSEEITNTRERQMTSELRAYIEVGLSSGYPRAFSVQGSLRGEYGNQQVTTARVEFTEQTDFLVNYPGNRYFDQNNSSKIYTVGFVLYTDSDDGHIILDWYVPSHGAYYAQQYSRGTGAQGLGSARFGSGLVGSVIWGDIGTSAVGGAYIYTENMNAQNGTEINVPIRVRNAENVKNMDIELRFDSSVLRAKEAISGTLTQNSLLESNVGDTVRIAFVDTQGISGNGSVAVVTFEVIGAPGSECTLVLTASGNTVSGARIDFSTGNGIIKVLSTDAQQESLRGLRGDCDGNGRLDSNDAKMALQMAVGTIEVNLIADMNGDSRVTSTDAAQILDIAAQTSLSRASDAMRGYHPGIKEHEIVDYSRMLGGRR